MSEYDVADELRRQAALYALALLDTEPEEEFDRIARLAQRPLGVTSAVVSFMDHDRQWYKARVGVDAAEAERSTTFCQHVIADGEPLVVEDATGDPRFATNVHVTAPGGVRFYAGVPIHSPGHHAIGTLCVFDSTPRVCTNEDLAPLFDLALMVDEIIAARQQSTVDELTGVQNRRGFQRAAGPLLALADRVSLPMTLGYFDVNGLKAINDIHGHDAGDRVIAAAARLLARCFRAADVVARLGGDEFAVLFAGTDAGGAAAATARLTEAIAAHNEQSKEPFDLAIAVGFATRHPGGIGVEDLLAEADAAMYRDKHS